MGPGLPSDLSVVRWNDKWILLLSQYIDQYFGYSRMKLLMLRVLEPALAHSVAILV